MKKYLRLAALLFTLATATQAEMSTAMGHYETERPSRVEIFRSESVEAVTNKYNRFIEQREGTVIDTELIVVPGKNPVYVIFLRYMY